MKKNLLIPNTVLFIAFPFFTMAQAPSNDECSGAISTATNCTTQVAATTVNATQSPFPSSCTTTDADDDIWYSFIAGTSSISVTISDALLQSGGTADIGMEIIFGPCVDPAPIFCDNDIASGNGEQTVNDLNPGSRYFIKFWTTGTASQATFNFCLQDLAVVPVKISAYFTTCVNGSTIINWTTTAEVNTHLFTVERSEDAIHFETVAAVNASGNANGKSYSVTDLHPFKNNGYYRLRETDLDGRQQYYKTLPANCGRHVQAISAWPNPAANTLAVALNNQFKKGMIAILSANGSVVDKIACTPNQDNTLKIDIQHLPKGIYLLQITNTEGDIEFVKFLKQ